jgi:hypothetical protein
MAIELGRIGNAHTGSTLANFMAIPREMHLALVVRIFYK